MQNGCYPSKIALRLNIEVCYKVSLCKSCQQQSCKAFTAISIRAKMARGGRPYYANISPKLIQPLQLRRFPTNTHS